MRLVSLSDGTRDGCLALVDAGLTRCVRVDDVSRDMQSLLDRWDELAPGLRLRQQRCHASGWAGAEPFAPEQCLAPLSRAYQWADSSVYASYSDLQRRRQSQRLGQGEQRGADARAAGPRGLLVYQGGSDVMLSGHEPIIAVDESHGIDLEPEIAVVTGDIPMGSTPDEALRLVRLVVLVNDVSLRHLAATELAKGFGFYQSKPATSFAPVAVTPESLGTLWTGGLLDAKVVVHINRQWLGAPNSGAGTTHHFGHILAYMAHTRALAAGTIVGAGTVSNADPACGSGCINEARARQSLAGIGDTELMPFLRHDDLVSVEAFDRDEQSIFGAIRQRVVVRPGR